MEEVRPPHPRLPPLEVTQRLRIPRRTRRHHPDRPPRLGRPWLDRSHLDPLRRRVRPAAGNRRVM